MTVKVKKDVSAKNLLERFNRHFGNKYSFNEDEEECDCKGEEGCECDKEKEVEEDGEAEPDAEKKPEDDAKEEDSVADNGEMGKGVMGIIEKLIKEDMSSDNDKQKAMCDNLSQLAESHDPQANAFMEALDNVMSSMEMQKNEDQDAEYLYVFQPEKYKEMAGKADFGEAKKKDKKPVKKDKKK